MPPPKIEPKRLVAEGESPFDRRLAEGSSFEGEDCKYVASPLNRRLCQIYSGTGADRRDHFVRVESVNGTLHYVLRWRHNYESRKPVVLMPYDPLHLPYQQAKGAFLAFDLGDKDVILQDRGDRYELVAVKNESLLHSSHRFLVIPTDLRLQYAGILKMIDADVIQISYDLSGSRGVRQHKVESIVEQGVSQAGLYTLDIWLPEKLSTEPAKTTEVTRIGRTPTPSPLPDTGSPAGSATDQPRPTIARRTPIVAPSPVTVTLPPPPPPPSTGTTLTVDQTFRKRVVETIQGPKNDPNSLLGKIVQVRFLLDTSGSMTPMIDIARDNLIRLLDDFKVRGAKEVWFAVDRFCEIDQFEEVIPFTLMTAASAQQLVNRLRSVQADSPGSQEAVGDAIVWKLNQFRKGPNIVSSVIVLTDVDAVQGDGYYGYADRKNINWNYTGHGLSVNQAKAKAKPLGIAVDVHLMEDYEGKVADLSGSDAFQRALVAGDVQTLYQYALNTYNDREKRREAMRALKEQGTNGLASLQQLAAQLPETLLRLEAALWIKAIDVTQGRALLYQWALGERDETLRQTAAMEIIKEGAIAAPYIRDIALRSPDAAIQHKAATTLLQLDWAAGLAVLQQLAERAASELVRVLAANALFDAKVPNAAQYFRALALDATDPEVRRHAATAYGRLLEPRDRVPLTQIAFRDTNERRRLHAAVVMAHAGNVIPLALFFAQRPTSWERFDYEQEFPTMAGYATQIRNMATDLSDNSIIDAVRIAGSMGMGADAEFGKTVQAIQSVLAASTNSGLLVQALDGFAPYVDANGLRALSPLAEDVITSPLSAEQRQQIIGELIDFVRSSPTIINLPDLTAYKDHLLKNPTAMMIQVEGISFRPFPHLLIQEDGPPTYVDADRAAGVARLKPFTHRTANNQAWLYVEYQVAGKTTTRWIGLGPMQRLTPASAAAKFVGALCKNPYAKVTNISYYTIRPTPVQREEYGVTFSSMPSEAVYNTLWLGAFVRSQGYSGAFDARFVTPVGQFTLTPTDMVARMKLASVAGVASAVETLYTERLARHPAGNTVDHDVVEDFRDSRLMQAAYVYDQVPLKALLNQWREMVTIVQRYQALQAKGLPSEAELRPILDALKQRQAMYTMALDAVRSAGATATILKFYEARHHEIGQLITSLDRLLNPVS